MKLEFTQIYRKIEVLKEGFDALELARTKFDAVEFAEAVKIVEKAMIDIHNLIFGKQDDEESYLTNHLSNANGLGKNDETLDHPLDDLIWIEINERIRYAYDEKNNEFILQHKKAGEGYRILKKWKFEDLKKIFDALPDRATIDDVRETAKAVGVNTSNLEHYLIRIFTHVKFGGDITSRNRKTGRPCMVLIKNPDGDFSLAEENR